LESFEECNDKATRRGERQKREVKDGWSATEQTAVEINHELLQDTPNPEETPVEVQDTATMDQLA
jgi:hypothetical protein